MKTVVTHLGPDLDAITSVWLVKTYLPGWSEADVAFVPAGKTLKGMDPDSDPEIMHVDTGFGRFDHHQTDADTCASRLVYEEISRQRKPDTALARLTDLVNDIDHFREVFFPEPTADFWDISLVSAIDGWRMIHHDDPLRVMTLGMDCLDGIYRSFKNKIWAEKIIKENGVVFETPWGKGMGLETPNDEVIHLAQKMGHMLVIRKDPAKKYIRIKAFPKPEIDLTPYYERLKKEEPDATWFLHASKHMILNGSTKNPDMKPTGKSLQEVIEVFKV